MKLLSVNLAERTYLPTPNGIVETGIVKKPVSQRVAVSEYGIAGDTIVDVSVHGGRDQAVYLYSQEDYAWWEETLGRTVPPGTFGENLTLSSFGPTPLVIGDRLTINNVVLEISAPRTPCFKLAAVMGNPAFIKAFVKAAKPGAYARVITTGDISAGDSVKLQKTPEDWPSVVEVFNECHSKEHNLALLNKAIASPLGEFHRKVISHLLEKAEGESVR